MNRSFGEFGYTVARVVFGLSLALLHGYGKLFNGGVNGLAKTVGDLGFPFPHFFAWCAGSAEFFGGLCVALGLLTRPAATFAGFTMMVAIYRYRNDGFASQELAILYLAVMAMVVVVGSGPYALDRMLKLRSPFARKTSFGG